MPHVAPSSAQPRKFRSSKCLTTEAAETLSPHACDVLAAVPARADAHAHATPGQPQDHA